jgi:hypothetical protein
VPETRRGVGYNLLSDDNPEYPRRITVRNFADCAHFREHRLHNLKKIRLASIESTLKKVRADQFFRDE